MKIEVGKFYKNRIGEKVKAVRYGNGGDVVFLSDGNSVWADSGTYWIANTYHYRNEDFDLIEEWKEPEVKGPKFKVGDRVRDLGWDGKTIGTITKIAKDGEYTVDYSPHEAGICSGYENRYCSQLELVKPEITVNSRWTNIGKESKTVVVVYINDKYVTFEHEGRGTVETTIRDTFYAVYKPYVQPPKSLVGYVGIIDDGDYQRFTLVCPSEEEVRSMYSVTNYNIVAIKKIEWTEGG